MIFEASRAKAVDKLNHFVENNLSEYSKLRNFDFGPDNRSNISCLSPYITHGIVNELEVIDKSLKKFSFSKNEKFIQEVLWRVYWKGWLELRPNVWSDYLVELNNLRMNLK
jgi:deoxyribodipyrimidine photolyase